VQRKKGLDVKSAKEQLESLHMQSKDSNVSSNERTAAQLSARFCVENFSFFENQLETLKILLSFGAKIKDQTGIIEYLDGESDKTNLSFTGF